MTDYTINYMKSEEKLYLELRKEIQKWKNSYYFMAKERNALLDELNRLRARHMKKG